ncbi:hypothetical protein LCGC14_2242540 [marine sediment metagenome]|uniref:Uncharacterized protein n=1 Tax=marine sediment metagenome TaxID=412755 RepID=A0A0F9DSK2_9ZZZZ
MIPTRIFLDLDDVCNDFTMHALKHVGCLGSYDPKWGFDIIAAANGLSSYSKFTPDAFWGLMAREVWASLPESEEFHSLLSKCEKLVGRENICILTAR